MCPLFIPVPMTSPHLRFAMDRGVEDHCNICLWMTTTHDHRRVEITDRVSLSVETLSFGHFSLELTASGQFQSVCNPFGRRNHNKLCCCRRIPFHCDSAEIQGHEDTHPQGAGDRMAQDQHCLSLVSIPCYLIDLASLGGPFSPCLLHQ